jgi:hypothetical protein
MHQRAIAARHQIPALNRLDPPAPTLRPLLLNPEAPQLHGRPIHRTSKSRYAITYLGTFSSRHLETVPADTPNVSAKSTFRRPERTSNWLNVIIHWLYSRINCAYQRLHLPAAYNCGDFSGAGGKGGDPMIRPGASVGMWWGLGLPPAGHPEATGSARMHASASACALTSPRTEACACGLLGGSVTG